MSPLFVVSCYGVVHVAISDSCLVFCNSQLEVAFCLSDIDFTARADQFIYHVGGHAVDELVDSVVLSSVWVCVCLSVVCV